MAEPEPQERREYHGHAVDPVTKEIRFLSPTSLEKADTRAGAQGCSLKYYYRYVMGWAELEKEKGKEAKQRGIAMHRRIAQHLTTGEQVLLDLEMIGGHMIPPPGPDLFVEGSLSSVKNPLVTADGIPVILKVDVLHARGVNYGGSDVEDTLDPPGTVELIDWKRRSNDVNRDGESTLIRAEDLASSIQMAGYGIGADRAVPDVEHVRLSHGYFIEKGKKARKVTRLHVVDDCLQTWEYVDSLARTLRDVVREPDPSRIPGNRHACDAYGGCPYQQQCHYYGHASEYNTLEALAGERGAAALFATMKENLPMSLMKSITGANGANPLQANIAALQQREAAAVPLPSPNAPPAGMTFPDAVRTIRASGLGFPVTRGAAAQALAQMENIAAPADAAYCGSGQLGANSAGVSDPAQIIAMAQEIAGPPAPPVQAPAPVQMVTTVGTAGPAIGFAPTPVQIVGGGTAAAPPTAFANGFVTFPPGVLPTLPPDAPRSQPHLAAEPLPPEIAAQYPQIPAPVAPPSAGVAVSLPLAPVTAVGYSSAAAVAQAHGFTPAPIVPQQTIAEQAAGTKKKRGPKPAAAPAPIVNMAEFNAHTHTIGPAPAPLAPAPVPNPGTIVPDSGTGFRLFVNCTPSSDYESLNVIGEKMMRAMAQHYACGDVRETTGEHATAFARWKGILASSARKMAREMPLTGDLVLETGGEVAELLLEALAPEATLVVRGRR